MTRKLKVISAAAVALLVSGCATVAPVGVIYTGMTMPITATDHEGQTKTGEATCTGILALVATGDCSIATAAQKAGIKKIKSVDHQSTSILGVYTTYTVIVKGE